MLRADKSFLEMTNFSTTIQFFFAILFSMLCLQFCHPYIPPTSQPGQRLVFQLHSMLSGKFVAVYRGGRVHAHAQRPSK